MKLVSALFAAGALATACTPLCAQANVVRAPGVNVEILGLEDWTVPRLEALLRADGRESLTSGACAAVLQELGFPAATAVYMNGRGDSTEYITVSLVEPADSVRVRRFSPGSDTLRVRPGWELLSGLAAQPHLYGRAIRMMGRDALPRMTAADSAQMREIWAFWAAHGTPADLAAARTVLAGDPGVLNRVAAASLLAHGPAPDEVWRQLMHSMREQNDHVSAMAAYSLTVLARTPRRVDWTPAAEDVHALLRGTTLWHLNDVMDVLRATGADSTSAALFLAGGGEAVLARLDSREEFFAGPAHRFLVTLRGADLGRDPAAWRAWVASLRRAE